MDQQRLIPAAIVGGLVSGLMYSIPILNLINVCCCIGIMIGGAVALLYYDRSLIEKTYLTPNLSIIVGVAAGVAGAFFAVLIDWLIYLQFGLWELELFKKLIENMESSPEAYELFDEIIRELEQEAESGYTAGKALTEFLINIIIFPLFCMVGSVLTRLVINKGRTATDQTEIS